MKIINAFQASSPQAIPFALGEKGRGDRWLEEVRVSDRPGQTPAGPEDVGYHAFGQDRKHVILTKANPAQRGVLVRINTSGTYTKGSCGSVALKGGPATLLTHGMWAEGDAGRVAQGPDQLWHVEGPALFVVKRQGGENKTGCGHFYVLVTRDLRVIAIKRADLCQLIATDSDPEVSAVARQFAEPRTGIYAKITIRGGRVYDDTGAEVREFTIGGSGRAMHVGASTDGRVRLQTFYSSGQPMSEVMSIPDGSYAISRDAGQFFLVDFDNAGTVTTVHDQVNPTYFYEETLQYSSGPSTSRSNSPFGALAGLPVGAGRPAAPTSATTEPVRSTNQPPLTQDQIAAVLGKKTKTPDSPAEDQAATEEAERTTLTADQLAYYQNQLRQLLDRLTAIGVIIGTGDKDKKLTQQIQNRLDGLDSTSPKKAKAVLAGFLRDVDGLSKAAQQTNWPVDWPERALALQAAADSIGFTITDQNRQQVLDATLLDSDVPVAEFADYLALL